MIDFLSVWRNINRLGNLVTQLYVNYVTYNYVIIRNIMCTLFQIYFSNANFKNILKWQESFVRRIIILTLILIQEDHKNTDFIDSLRI